jgi:hypothetical protein
MGWRLIIFMVVMPLLWLALHLYLDRRLVKHGALPLRARRGLRVLIVACAVVPVVTMTLGRAGLGDASLNGRELAVAAYLNEHIIPCLIGRDMIGQAVSDFIREGAWGVSPHVIPHRSLHSTSGTITLALDCRGPNYGIGGGPGG